MSLLSDSVKYLHLLIKPVLIYVTCLVLIKVILLIRSAKRYKSFAQKEGNFLFGNLFEVLPIFGDKTHLVRSALERFSSNFGHTGFGVFWLSWFPIIGVFDYKKTQEILVKPSILDKGFPFEYLRYCIGDGILCSSASKWKERKKLIRPKFTAASVTNFIPTVQSKSQLLLEKLSTIEGVCVDVTKTIPLTSLSILIKVTLGVDMEESKLSSLETSLSSFIKNTLFRAINPLLWPDQAYNLYAKATGLKSKVQQVDSLVKEVVVNHLKERNNLPRIGTKVDYRAALDESIMAYFLEQLMNEPGITVDEAIEATIEEMKTLFIAGFDGPNNALVWLVYILGLHSEIQEKIYSEVHEFDETTVDLNVIKQWNYTEQCVKEILRIIPPAPFATRLVTKDEPFDDKIIPQDSFIFFSIYSIHRDEKIYPNPTTFDPDRFEPSRVSSIPSGAYIPFGLRPRDCIGQRFAMIQMKLVIAMIVKHFRIVSTKPYDLIGQEIDFTLKPTEPLYSSFYQRNNNSQLN